jgi:hypothetical protein
MMTDIKSKNENGLPAEKIKKPGIINQLIPWMLTIAIFIWLYFTIDFRQMFYILGQAKLGCFIPFMVGFVILLGVIDSFTFGQAYSWFCTKLTTYEKFELRVAPYVMMVIFAPIAEVFFLIYLWRKKGVSPAHAVSSSIWTIVNDYAALATVITIAVIYNLGKNLVPQINIYWLAAMIIFWALYFSNLFFWHSSLQPRIAAWIERSHKVKLGKQKSDGLLLKIVGGAIQLLRTFSIARWYHYLCVYGLRLLVLIGILVSNYAALKALDIDVPLPLALIAIPVIYSGHFLPINVGGFGGPQALSILFFYEIGHCGSKEQIVAYSFLWSTGFFISRFMFGLIFIRGFWKTAFPEGFANWLKRDFA